jgi:hypothetical protein
MNKQIEPDKIIGGAIAIYENVWLDYKESIKNIESIIKDKNLNINFEPSSVLGDIDNKRNIQNLIRTSSNMGITTYVHKNEHLKNIDKKCNNIIDSALEKYKELFLIDTEIFNVEGFQLLRYGVGGQYKAHHDAYPAVKRAVSVLIYLNDDYEGGEIEFINFDLKIKPKAGTLILFPSNYPYKHIAHPVTSGTKYVLVTWLHER